MKMRKIGIHRLWGILIALAIMITAFILFNLMTYLKMDKQVKELEQVAQQYNSNYKVYLSTSNTLRGYNTKISERANELNELEKLMQSTALNYRKEGNKIIFSGIVNPGRFSQILNYLSDAKTLKINKLSTQSQSELPLLIGDSEIPDMLIQEMEIEIIQINEKILEG
ncbi:MAG TPA: hypothetical protein P5107_10640 [Thermotogota bacterium]|nr:hypothetical protein [Thermotogota bacterium]